MMTINGQGLARVLTAAGLLGLATGAAAQIDSRTISGSAKGLSWVAGNRIVAVGSTATIAGGGSPFYQPNYAAHSGVAALIMDFGPGGIFICSGSLMPDRQSIVTAAHCVTDPNLGKPISTTAYFYGGPNGDTVVPLNPIATAVTVSQHYIHPDYTGEVIDQNDIAILKLSTVAPGFARAYDFYWGDDLDGGLFNIAGYGARSDTGASVGSNLGPGRLRQGFNIYDYALGDPRFGGFWDGLFGTADVTNSWVYDMDNGLLENDLSCIIGLILTGEDFGCTPTLGFFEAASAGGDSGGPQFFGGRIASITSYGLSFGSELGDIDDELNDTYGEWSGVVPMYLHRSWILSVVPEPASWAMMIAGFGLVGFAARRRRRRAVSA